MWLNRKKRVSLHSLENKLTTLFNTALPQAARTDMRKNVMKMITSQHQKENFGHATLIEKIKALAPAVKPREYFRILLREKLITLIEFNKRRFADYLTPFRVSQKALAAFGVFIVFVLTILFNFTINIDRVEASFTTELDEVSGDVVVIRDTQEIKATPQFLLKGDDVVRTGKDSRAVIRFLDQSVTRLDENTEVKISKLFINPRNKSETVVELVLNHGQLWARVINLIDDFSRFQVKANNTVAVAKKKAAFNVSLLTKGKAKVSAISHRVDLVVATDKKVVETTLVNGFIAEVKKDVSTLPVIHAEKEGQDAQWVSENLAQDKVYIESVKNESTQQLQNQVSVLPGNPFYAVKELSQNTQIAFTINDIERQKKIVEAAQEKLAESQLLLAKGVTDKAAWVLGDFKSQLAGVFEWIKKYEVQYPVQALDLRTQVDEVLSGYQKQLSLTLPNDPLYPLKKAIEDAQVNVAVDQQSKTQAQLSQATNKLLEAQDLADQGDEAGAAKQVEKYSHAIADVVSEVKQLPSDAQEKAVSAILDTKLEDLKSLETIAQPSTNKSVVSPAPAPQVDPTPPALPMTEKTPAAAPAITPNAPQQTLTNGASPAPTSGSVPLVPALPSGSTSGTPIQEKISTPQITPVPVTAAVTELEKSISQAKTETLTKLGEAVLEVQKNQSSVEVLQKLQDIKNIDVNGKPLVDLKLTAGTVLIKSAGSVISVTTPPLPSTPPAPVTTPLIKPLVQPLIKPVLPSTTNLIVPVSPLVKP